MLLYKIQANVFLPVLENQYSVAGKQCLTDLPAGAL